MFCPKCGKEVQAGGGFCEHCGAATSAPSQQYSQAPPGQYQAPPYQYQAPPPYYGAQPYGYGAPLPLKSAGLAAVLAVLIPGVGHIYVGKVMEGIIILILSIVIGSVGSVVVILWGLATWGVGFIFGVVILAIIYLVFWVWQIFDAYNKANQYNAALQQTGRTPW